MTLRTRNLTKVLKLVVYCELRIHQLLETSALVVLSDSGHKQVNDLAELREFLKLSRRQIFSNSLPLLY